MTIDEFGVCLEIRFRNASFLCQIFILAGSNGVFRCDEEV